MSEVSDGSTGSGRARLRRVCQRGSGSFRRPPGKPVPRAAPRLASGRAAARRSEEFGPAEWVRRGCRLHLQYRPCPPLGRNAVPERSGLPQGRPKGQSARRWRRSLAGPACERSGRFRRACWRSVPRLQERRASGRTSPGREAAGNPLDVLASWSCSRPTARVGGGPNRRGGSGLLTAFSRVS